MSLAEGSDLGLSLLDLGNDAFRSLEIDSAFRCERKAAGGAIEEPGTEPVLEPRHQLGYRRWRECELARRRREPAERG